MPIEPASPPPPPGQPDNSARWLAVYKNLDTAETHFGPQMRERVKPILESELDPGETKARIINIAWFLEQQKEPVDRESLLRNWSLIRPELGKKWFHQEKPNLTDRELYSIIGDNLRNEKDDNDEMNKIAGMLQDAAVSGETDFGKALAGSQAKKDDDGRLVWKNADTGDKRLLQLQKGWNAVSPEIEELRPLAEAALKWMSHTSGADGFRHPAADLGMGPEYRRQMADYEEQVEDFRKSMDGILKSESDLVPRLMELSPRKRELFYSILAASAKKSETNKPGREKGFGDKTNKTIERSFARVGRWLASGVGNDTELEMAAEMGRNLDAMRIAPDATFSASDNLFGRDSIASKIRHDEKGMAVHNDDGTSSWVPAKKAEGRPLTDEEKQIVRGKIDRVKTEQDIRDRLREIKEGEVDPVKYEGLVQSIWFKGLEQSGYIAQAFAGPLSPALLYVSTVGMRAEEYRQRGVDADQAANLAVVEAAPEALIEYITGRLLLDAVPWLKPVFQKLHLTPKTLPRVAARTAGTFAVENAWNVGQELIQDSIPLWWQTLKANPEIGIPEVDFDDPRNQVWTWSNIKEVMTSMFMYTLGGTGAASFRDMRTLKDANALRALGFTEGAVDQIIGQETRADAEAVMQGLWNDKEQRNPESDTAKEARKKMGKAAGEAAKQIATGALISRLPDGHFRVTAPDGEVVGDASTVEAAAALKMGHDRMPANAQALTAEQRAEAAARFESELAGHTEAENDAIYDAIPDTHGGTVFGADHAKEMSSEYRENRRKYNAAVHVPAGRYAVSRFRRELAKVKAEGKGANTVVIFSAGGQGSGKSTVNGIRADFYKANGKSVLVFDSTLNNAEFATGLIKEAAESGADVVVSYVHNPVENAMRRNIIRSKDKDGNNRMESAEQVGRIHYRSQQTFLSLAQNPELSEVSFEAWDNAGESGKHAWIENPVEFLKAEGTFYTDEQSTIARAKAAESKTASNDKVERGKPGGGSEGGPGGSGKGSGPLAQGGPDHVKTPSLGSRFSRWFEQKWIDDTSTVRRMETLRSGITDALDVLKYEQQKLRTDSPLFFEDELSGVAERLREAIDSGWLKKEYSEKLAGLLSDLEGMIEQIKNVTPFAAVTVRQAMNEKFTQIVSKHSEIINGSPGEITTPGLEDVVSRLRNAASGVVSTMIEKGMVNFSGKMVGPSLMEAVNGLSPEQVDNFNNYLLARRALAVWNDIKQPGRNPGIPKEEAEATVEKYDSDDFRRRAKIFYEWSAGLRNYAAEASVAMALGSEKITATDPGDYAPLWVGGHKTKDAIDGGPSDKFSPGLEGDTRRPDWAPVDALMMEAEIVVHRAHERHIWEMAKNMAKGNEALEGFIEAVDKSDVPAHETTPDDIYDDVVTDGDYVYAKDIGTEQWYRIEKGIYDVINSINQRVGTFGTTVWGKALREAAKGNRSAEFLAASGIRTIELLDSLLKEHARMWRAGATGLRPAFGLGTNVVRDLFTLNYNTRVQYDPFSVTKNWFQAMTLLGIHAVIPNKGFGRNIKMAVAKTEMFKYKQLFENLGMNFSSSLTFDSNKLNILKAKVGRGGKLSWTNGTGNKISSGWEYFVNVLQFPETAARIAEMKTLAEKKGWDVTEGLNAKQIAELVRAGKEVTVDFTRAGEYARIWNRYVPFINSSIQGKKSAYDAFKRNPVGWLFTRGLVMSLVAAANWYRNKDEDWWKEIESGERFAFDFVRIGDEVLKIPRAFEVDTIFKGLVTEMLDAAYQEEPERVTEWFKSAFEEFSVVGSLDTGLNIDVVPPVAREGIQQKANYDFFWKSPIVSRTQQLATEEGRMERSEQYGPYTSTIAIWLGEKTGWSPRRIDHAVRGLAAGVGGDIMTLAGRGPEADGADIPIIGGFFKEGDWEPSDFPIWGRAFLRKGGTEINGGKSVNRLYDLFGEMIEAREQGEFPEGFREMADAIRAVQMLGEAHLRSGSREERAEISAKRTEIARKAVERFKGED
jgi:hypothetical protein